MAQHSVCFHFLLSPSLSNKDERRLNDKTGMTEDLIMKQEVLHLNLHCKAKPHVAVTNYLQEIRTVSGVCQNTTMYILI